MKGAEKLRKDRSGGNGSKVREWLIQAREAQGMTQGAVAGAAGIAQPSYFEIEKGISTPRPERVRRPAPFRVQIPVSNQRRPMLVSYRRTISTRTSALRYSHSPSWGFSYQYSPSPAR